MAKKNKKKQPRTKKAVDNKSMPFDMDYASMKAVEAERRKEIDWKDPQGQYMWVIWYEEGHSGVTKTVEIPASEMERIPEIDAVRFVTKEGAIYGFPGASRITRYVATPATEQSPVNQNGAALNRKQVSIDG